MIEEIQEGILNENAELLIRYSKIKKAKSFLFRMFILVLFVVSVITYQVVEDQKKKYEYVLRIKEDEKKMIMNYKALGGSKNGYTEKEIYADTLYRMKHYNLTKANRTFPFLGYPFLNPKEAYLIEYNSQFVYRKKDKYFHTGMDICSQDYNIRSIYFGRVEKIVKHDTYYGNYLVITQDIDGIQYRFLSAHMSFIYVKEGQFIKKGEVIGLIGNEGKNSTGYHYHLEIMRKENGRWVWYNYFSENIFKGKYYLKY